MIPVEKSLKNGQREDPGKYKKTRDRVAARPAQKSDLKSIDPLVFCEKNTILQDRHNNCRILVANKLKKRANSMSHFSIYSVLALRILLSCSSLMYMEEDENGRMEY